MLARRRVEIGVVLAAAAAAVAGWLIFPTYPAYDAYYHLVWGREILDGRLPSFEAYKAPTQHPLYVAWATLLVPLGQNADRVMVLTTLLAMVALVWGTFRLAETVFGTWPGVAAAAFAGSSFSFLLYAVRAYVDVPFLALVVWAGALEARRPRRGPPVMAMLALAGLLRPEAWILAGAYWLWCLPGASLRRRVALAAGVAAGPVAWALTDFVVTGNPLYSPTSTSELAEELGRPRGLAEVPGAFVAFLAATVRPPVALLALAGGVLAWRRVEHRRLIVPVALFATGVVTFVGTGIAGLSILPRYLTVPAVALCVFAGYAWLGFTTAAPGSRLRRRWRRLAVVAGVMGAAFVLTQLGSVSRLVSELRFVGGSRDDLVALLDRPEVRDGMRCGPLTFPNYRLVPDARWYLDAPGDRVGARSALRREYGVAVFVLGQRELRRYGFADGASPITNVPEPGFAPIARQGRFVAYGRCPG